MTNFAENWNAQASSSQETSKSKWKPEVIQGQGIEAGKVPEDVVLGSGYVSAHTESTESPIDMKEVVAGKIPEPPKFEGVLPEPKPYDTNERFTPEEFSRILTKPHLPKPRKHGVGSSQGIEAGKVPEDVVLGSEYVPAHTESTEPPIDMKEVIAGKIPEPPKFEGVLPEPKPYDTNERFTPEEFSRILTKPHLPKPRKHGVGSSQGIEAGKVPEDVVLGSEYVPAHTESTEPPIDMKEVIADKIPEPPKFEGTLPEPREHGIESPIDFKKVATGEVPELPKFKGTLPKPKPYKKAA